MTDARLTEIRRTRNGCSYHTVQGMLTEALAEISLLRSVLQQRGQVAAKTQKETKK